jgi:hypothetical protein
MPGYFLFEILLLSIFWASKLFNGSLRLFAGFSMLIENASSMKGNEAGGETRDYLL